MVILIICDIILVNKSLAIGKNISILWILLFHITLYNAIQQRLKKHNYRTKVKD